MKPVNGFEHMPAGAAGLRELFARPGVVRIVGAHNPLGARLAERAGFDGVWSSGLEISASQGLPDTDLLSMAELQAVAASLAATVDIPVVADCDTGYGNALNVMHTIRRYERAGLAGVSIEDKVFPKVNSFVAGRQELCPPDEFCGKIEAAKSAQRSTDFMVIARTEALIAGHGMDEALARGEAYAEAGADAVLIHAKGVSPEPVLEFLSRWKPALPVVVVPTTYHTITADQLHAAGAKMVIYANHGLRAGINAVTEVFDTILKEGRTTGVEERIAPLATVFDLQGMARLKADEERFVRSGGSGARAVVVPDPHRGVRGGDETVSGTDLTELRAPVLRESGTRLVLDTAAGGHVDAAEVIADVPAGFRGRTLVIPDAVFADADAMSRLASTTADIAVLVDVTARETGAPPVTLSSCVVAGRRLGLHLVTALGDGAAGDAVFTGSAAFSPAAFTALQQAAEKRLSGEATPVATADLLADLVAAGWSVQAVVTAGGWTEVRSRDDLSQLSALASGQVTA
ncbi:isocitrate lyase/phosphoenolpyruvate mutase family protein [Streptomyces sp. NPDC019531]|uniref:isocitrate lyase/phosphoenolpyruvate mutase family protein n=1 Tax=Streptomyces sp. NPDC019531 TaxID=3365062 RepID=UPI00384B4D52